MLHINSLTDSDTIMKEITTPKASILIEYNDVSVVVVAADDGNFSYTYNDTLTIGTNINFTVKMYESLIYTSKEIQIVYSGENNGGSVKITNISWSEDKGILLKLNNPLENNTKYSAEITWILEE